MLTKILALVLIALFVMKLAFRPQLAQLKARLDRFVNVLIVAIIISWVLQFVWRFVL